MDLLLLTLQLTVEVLMLVNFHYTSQPVCQLQVLDHKSKAEQIVHMQDLQIVMVLVDETTHHGFENTEYHQLHDMYGHQDPPEYLQYLLSSMDSAAKAFRNNIRKYNSALTFTSLKYTVDDRTYRATGGIQCFQIHGKLFHL